MLVIMVKKLLEFGLTTKIEKKDINIVNITIVVLTTHSLSFKLIYIGRKELTYV